MSLGASKETLKYNLVAQVIYLKDSLAYQRRVIPTSGLKRFRNFRPVGIGQFFVIKMPRMNLGMKLTVQLL